MLTFRMDARCAAGMAVSDFHGPSTRPTGCNRTPVSTRLVPKYTRHISPPAPGLQLCTLQLMQFYFSPTSQFRGDCTALLLHRCFSR